MINALVFFQSIMNGIPKEFSDPEMVVYLDDMLIYSENPTQHCLLVSKLIYWFLENGQVADIEQCIFEEKDVEFLDNMIWESGVAMALVKSGGNHVVGNTANYEGFTNVLWMHHFLPAIRRRIPFPPSTAHESHLKRCSSVMGPELQNDIQSS